MNSNFLTASVTDRHERFLAEAEAERRARGARSPRAPRSELQHRSAHRIATRPLSVVRTWIAAGEL
jgi:hypothetical protein